MGLQSKIESQYKVIEDNICFRLLPQSFLAIFNNYLKLIGEAAADFDSTVSKIQTNAGSADYGKRSGIETAAEIVAGTLTQLHNEFSMQVNDCVNSLENKTQSKPRLRCIYQVSKDIKEGKIREKLSRLTPDQIEKKFDLISYSENEDLVDAILSDPVGALVKDETKRKLERKRQEYLWGQIKMDIKRIRDFQYEIVEVFFKSLLYDLVTNYCDTRKDEISAF